MKMEYLKGVATLRLDESRCIGCDMCVTVCPGRVLGYKHECVYYRQGRVHGMRCVRQKLSAGRDCRTSRRWMRNGTDKRIAGQRGVLLGQRGTRASTRFA